MRRWSLLTTLLAALIALSSFAPVLAQDATPVASPEASPEASPVAQASGVHGVDVANLDTTTDPGQDFYRYATGGWLDRMEIPADEARYGSFDVVDDLTIEQLLGLLEGLGNSDDVPVGSDEWKAIQFFRQATDLKTRNAQGVEPISGDLEAIDAISTQEELRAFLRIAGLYTHLWGLYGIFAQPDLADSSVMTAWYGGPALGLPNRDYYWVDDENNEAIRAAYKETSAKLLEYLGYDAARAETAVNAVYDFEKALAEPLLRPEDYNDPANYYNVKTVEELVAIDPLFDWPDYLEIMGIPDQKSVVITEVKYLEAVDDILAATDLQTVKDFLKLQLMWFSAGELTEEIAATAFAFAGTTLYGIPEQEPIDEQALDAVNAGLGHALGKLYVANYFPPEAKAQVEALVARLVDASRVRIQALDWMSPETKATAIAKLDALRVKVGYPDKWITYEDVVIEESYAETSLSANIVEYKRQLAQIGKPVDRDEWGMLPQTVNAYYNPSNNEIVFPAAILQAPFFDYQADPASNYGGIGAVIGHEITHGFDQSGSQFDANGNFTDWWTAEDKTRFEELTAGVVAQYDAIEVLPGLNVDGSLTIGENIADMGGLQIAYDALQAELKESGDPGPIDGLTQDQRFFLAHAFNWAQLARDEYLTTLVKTNEHAPAQVRGAQPQRNMGAFFDAFGIEPGDPVYLAPEERIVIW
jgi:predicted metalloendopeptidase